MVVVGSGLRYLSAPLDRIPPEMTDLGIGGPAAESRVRRFLVGPYGGDNHDLRHRRLLRTELGVAPALTEPRNGAQIGRWAKWSESAALSIVPTDLAAITTLNGRPYRGAFAISLTRDRLTVINTVRLADYLASVVGAEMPAGWELEALKAQAVAARTYALRNLQPSANFDICDDQRCQAYNGVGTESPQTRDAVAATGGVVAIFDDELIQAFYSANAGDFTESAENVWGLPEPYLRAVASPGDAAALSVGWGSAGYRWRREMHPAEFQAIRPVREAGIGEALELRVTRTADSGRPLTVRVLGSDGVLDLTGDEIRTAFRLPSAFMQISVAPPRKLELINPTTRRTGALIEDRYEQVERRRSVAFMVAPPDIRLYNGAVVVAEFERPETIVFDGRGFGHGVGMSQWGAQGMALDGHAYDEILKYYYQGIELRVLGSG